MFSRKHYKAIAKIINEEKICLDADPDTCSLAINVVSDIASDLAVYFQQDNPRFDRKKFMTACGL